MREAKFEPSQVAERLKGAGGPQSPEQAAAREFSQHRQPEPWVQACSECWIGAISASCRAGETYLLGCRYGNAADIRQAMGTFGVSTPTVLEGCLLSLGALCLQQYTG